MESGKEEIIFVRKTSGLIRTIGPITILSIGASYTIADGFYLFTAGLGYKAPGSNIPLALSIGGIMMAFMAFAVVFLTVALPRTASEYVAISRVLHPLPAYIEALVTFGVHIWIVGALSYFLAWFWGSFFIQAGILTKNTGLISLGEFLTTNVEAGVIIGIIFVVLFSGLQLLGANIFRYIVNVLFFLTLAAGISNIIVSLYVASLPLESIKSLWDSTYGTGAFDEIVSVANQYGWNSYITTASGIERGYGWPGPWSLSVTLFVALLTSAYAFWGFEFANYVAGEVSKPKRSFFVGVIGAILLIFFFYLVISTFTLLGFKEFYSMYNYVMNNPEAQASLKMNPVQTPTWAVYLANVIGGSLPWLSVLITLAVPLAVMDGLPSYIMVPTRIAFALSFDRMFPEKLAEVNDRFRSPHWAILTVMVLGIIMVILTAYSPWVYLISVITAITLRWLFSAITLTLLPYRRPDIFSEGYTKKIGNIPVVTIVGIIATIFSLIILGIGISLIIGDIVSITWLLLWIILAVALFYYYKYKNMKKGIDISKIYKEVPPL
jgi:amino acid transporter